MPDRSLFTPELSGLSGRSAALAAAVTLCTGTASLAGACPTASDLDNGIRVTSPNGEVETFTRFTPNIVLSEFFYEPGEGSRNLLARGTYLVQVNDIVAGKLDTGSRATFTFVNFTGGPPVPKPGLSWDSRVIILDEDGFDWEMQRMTVGTPETMTIGACSFEALPLAFDFSDGAYLEEQSYLPQLGIALLTRTQEEGSDAETYIYDTITAIGD